MLSSATMTGSAFGAEKDSYPISQFAHSEILSNTMHGKQIRPGISLAFSLDLYHTTQFFSNMSI